MITKPFVDTFCAILGYKLTICMFISVIKTGCKDIQSLHV